MLCINGDCLAIEDIKIGNWLNAEGFQFGIGVFETLRVYKQAPEDLEAHLIRLNKSATALGIAVPESLKVASKLLETLGPLLASTSALFSVLKIGLIKDGADSQWWAQVKPFTYKKSQLPQGLSATIADTRRNSTSTLVAHKTLNYAENWLEKQKSVENGYQEVLFLNESGWLAEGAVSNLFMVKAGKWYTPHSSCGLLNGIMRQRVIDAITKAFGGVEEGLISLAFLQEADHVFVTNALMGIMPVSAINHKIFKMPNQALETFLEQVDPMRINFE